MNRHSMESIIVEKQPELFNVSVFLRTINHVARIKLLQSLRSKSSKYTDLMLEMGIKPRTGNSGKFAYHVRRIRDAGLITLDKKTDTYHLTFIGIKAVQLLDSVQKITNMSISNPDDALTKMIIDLNQNESWLKPLIQKEMRDAAKHLTENKRLIDIVSDYGQLERVCLEAEFCTTPGVDVEKLQKLLLEKSKEKQA